MMRIVITTRFVMIAAWTNGMWIEEDAKDIGQVLTTDPFSVYEGVNAMCCLERGLTLPKPLCLCVISERWR